MKIGYSQLPRKMSPSSILQHFQHELFRKKVFLFSKDKKKRKEKKSFAANDVLKNKSSDERKGEKFGGRKAEAARLKKGRTPTTV